MSTDPDQIRADIERTRSHLSYDVDTLVDETSPKRIAKRQAGRVRNAFSGAKDRVMGSASHAGDKLDPGAAKDQAKEKMSEAGDTVREQTEGNPLAAGLIAFGAGLLIGSVFRSSQAEQRLAGQAKEALEPVREEAVEMARSAAEDLKGSARESAEAVKQTATEAGHEVKDTGRSAAGDVQGQVRESQQQVRQAGQ